MIATLKSVCIDFIYRAVEDDAKDDLERNPYLEELKTTAPHEELVPELLRNPYRSSFSAPVKSLFAEKIPSADEDLKRNPYR